MRYRGRVIGAAAAAVAVIALAALIGIDAASGRLSDHDLGPKGDSHSNTSRAAGSCGGTGLGMSNPAATYCRELGYEYRFTETKKGTEGTCFFPDGSSCEEWRFLEGKCGEEHSYCAQHGYDQETKSNGRNSLSREYAVCLDKGEEVGPVSELMDISRKSTKSTLPVVDSPPVSEPPIAGDVPSSFDWRNQAGQDWMTSVKNQGSCGSCWAFATAGAMESVYNVRWNDPALDLDLSEEYLVSDCYTMGMYGNCCGGSYVDALLWIMVNGIPDEGCMPYVDMTSCTCPLTCDSNCTYNTGGSCSDATCSDRCPDYADRVETVSGIGEAATPAEIKQHLIDKGPLLASIGVGSGYGGGFDGSGIYRCSDDSGANHAVVVAGYDDAGSYWIIKNSWGSTWNGDGYFKVGYGECSIEEWVFYIDVPAADSDDDGVADPEDNCPTAWNPPLANGLDDDADGIVDEANEQVNTDSASIDNGPDVPGLDLTSPGGDLEGDACDDDDDDDWMLDTGTHPLYGTPGEDVGCGSGPTNPGLPDTDGDNVIDGAECLLGSDPNNSASKPSTPPYPSDRDGDRLLSSVDLLFCPSDVDSDGLIGDQDGDCDGDGLADGLEVKFWRSLSSSRNSDGDSCEDDKEVADVNGDHGAILSDALIVARMAFGLTTPHSALDLNKDGTLTMADALLSARNSTLMEPDGVCP